METFEFLPKFGKSSFLQKQESSHLNGFIDSRFRGNDKEGRFSKVSLCQSIHRNLLSDFRFGHTIIYLP